MKQIYIKIEENSLQKYNNNFGGVFLEKLKDFIYLIKEKRKIIIFSIIGLLLFSLFLIFLILNRNKTIKESIEEQSNNELVLSKEEKLDNKEDNKDTNEIRVEIKGEVKKPGVYTLDTSKRVIDVINKAGGLTKSADISIINQSMKIKDEMVIIIYSKEEILSFIKNKKIDTTKLEVCKDEVKVNNDACITSVSLSDNKSLNNSTGSTSNKINDTFAINNKISINNASITDFTTLPGIGEAKAKSIIEYREKEGEFKSIEDIMKVSGIGEALFEKIKDYITI